MRFLEMETKKEERRKAVKFGENSEQLVSEEYMRRGYTILERRWRMGKTEIDLIARKDDVVVIIEVKARKDDEEGALEAVSNDKRRRMIRAADSYLKKLTGDVNYRFDIVALTGTEEKFKIEIVEDAFLATDII